MFIQVHFVFDQHIPLKKNYDYRNSWNLIKTTIIVIINEYTSQVKTLAS